MDFNEFKEELIEIIKGKTEENTSVTVHTVNKNNGIILKFFVITSGCIFSIYPV